MSDHQVDRGKGLEAVIEYDRSHDEWIGVFDWNELCYRAQINCSRYSTGYSHQINKFGISYFALAFQI
ncbi:MAG: hypothetical protein KDA77_02225 [Planctomycetaceae bacterium]|nr:hypothetical protein [Planctomycetaceae bacterium]